ncbi:MAG: choline dehydrogenase-like flavoprotein [Herbinix sp.]|jgi:choline dehydrogenase-like flavoprotein|nr:choline dehydrogenase-like flavoprotein [Herbinix sp.]
MTNRFSCHEFKPADLCWQALRRVRTDMNNGYDADVIIIGAGAGGAVVAKELSEKGVKVLVLDAGPWYGNKQWPNPNGEQGGESSSSYDDLSIELLKASFTDLEDDMNNRVYGKLRWGPANTNQPPWERIGGQVWQNAGIGGSTLHYYANCPRAFPQAINNVWPISYEELIPYYEKVESTLPINPAPITAKEAMFYYGAKKAGWNYLEEKELTAPGYRNTPNAIYPVNARLNDPDFDIQNNNLPGCTLRGHCVNGCHMGPTVDTVAKRSTMASYIPRALRTGNAIVRPNTFVIKVLTEENETEGIHAVGVRTRDTWTGEINEFRARVVVMSGGSIETPRLWLNSELPHNPWVGKGLTNHWFDGLTAIFDEKAIMDAIGVSDIKPYVGQNSAARFDYPGLGVLITVGYSPGLYASTFYASGGEGISRQPVSRNLPWDYEGSIVGEQLKAFMKDYTRSLSVYIFTDDEVDQNNSITLDPERRDENGFLPVINYTPNEKDAVKRDQLAEIAANIFRAAGAKMVLRSNWSPNIFIHIMSTMRIGFVTDTNCEANQVKRLYIADNSVLYNGIGGPNPTLTTQALATRTAEKIILKYFS